MITRRQIDALAEIITDEELLGKVLAIVSKLAPASIRQARWRAKKASTVDAKHLQYTSTKASTMGTIGVSSISRVPLEKKEISGCARDAQIDEWFEDLWPEYPKRQGQNPKKPAKAKFKILVRKGGEELALAIAGGVGRLAAALEHDGVEPRYFPQMITWLNQERWNDGIDEGGEPTGQGETRHINGNGSAHA